METFGQKLRQAIESQGLRREEVARVTGLEISWLEALERDDHAALPDDDAVAEGLQAFARLVDVDPDEVILDYRRERHALGHETASHAPDIREEMSGAGSEPVHAPSVPSPPAQPAISRPAGVPGRNALLAAGVVLAVAVLVWFFAPASRTNAPADAPARAAVSAQPSSPAPREARPDAPVAVGSPRTASAQDAPVHETRETTGTLPVAMSEEPALPSSRPEAATLRPSAPDEHLQNAERTALLSGPAVKHHGVGTGVVNHQLVGEAGRFAEGSRVWYWNWVEGATAGEVIDHVWLHEGQEKLTVKLKLGGPRWRTQSYKNLHPGSTGQWVVETRDASGRVLASRVFECFPSNTPS